MNAARPSARAFRLRLGAILLSACMALAACGGEADTRLSLGAECGGDDERCHSGVCFTLDSATSVCIRPCGGDDCPTGFVCASTPGHGRACLPAGLGGYCADDGGCPAGHLCDGEAGRCYIPVTRDLCSPCTSARQCPEGGACHELESGETYCTRPCESGSCPQGFDCLPVEGAGQQCVPANDARTCNAGRGLCSPCRGPTECGGHGDLCVRNLASGESFCGQACATDASCPNGFHCLDLSGEGRGPRQCVPNAGTCAGYCDTDQEDVVRRQCGLGASCDVAARTCVPATDGSLCSSCQDDDDCPAEDNSTRCLVNDCPECPFRGERFCAPGCTTDLGERDPSRCPTGFACVGVGAGGPDEAPFHCAPVAGTCRSGAGQLGDDCTAQGAAACLSGVCLGFGPSALCSATCSNDGDCGDGRFRCCAVTGEEGESFDCQTPVGEAGGVCSPLGGGFGADCSPGQAPCLAGACLDLGVARVCTAECEDPSECPEGFGCREARRTAPDGGLEALRVCFPEGGGELGSDCSFGPAACESGYCIRKASGNLCTRPCSDTAPCPSGYVCSAESTVEGQSAELCVPDYL